MSDILFLLLNDFFWLIQGLFVYQIICELLDPPDNRIGKFIGWVGIAIVSSVVIYPNDTSNISLVFLLFAAMILIIFRGKLIVKLSAVMVLFPIFIALNYLWNDITASLFFRLIGGYGWKNALFAALSTLLTVLFWYLFRKATKGKLSGIPALLDTKSWIWIDIICLASLTAVFSFVYFTPAETYKAYPCMIACIVTNIGSIRLSSYLADRIQREMEAKNFRVLQEYYEELESNHLQIRKLRHDMNSHLSAIGGLLQAGDPDGALSYSQKLTGYMETGNRRFCENGIVNALLNAKYNTATAGEIDCFFHVSIDALLSIDDIHLCTILANTLDNAIEACLKIEDISRRKLSVKARYTDNGYFSYEIINAKANPVVEKKGKYLTDKEDKKIHGLGIASVRDTVNRYGGTMDITHTDEEFHVVILIAAG